MVEDVEELASEAKAYLLRQPKLPLNGKISLERSETAQHIAPEIALGSGRRRDERGFVEDFAAGILRSEKFQRHS